MSRRRPSANVATGIGVLAFSMAVLAQGRAPIVSVSKGINGGLASVSGQVLAADGRPVWAATVAVRSQDAVLTRTTVTDGEGRFAFPNLPPGNYFLRALKSGYTAGDYGSAGFGKPPLAIALAPTAKMADATIVLLRGAVIAGRIVEQNGTPAVGVHVAAVTKQFINGQPRFVSAASTQTDDRGTYRLFGLPPATYAVAAVLRDMTSERAPTERTPDDDARGQPPGPRAMVRPLGPNSAASYLNVFFPGTFDPGAVSWLTVRADEEKADVDFPLRLARSGTLEGDVTLADGMRARSVRIVAYARTDNLSLGSGDFGTRAMTSPNGHFAFGGMQPGSYTLVASSTDGSQLAGITRVQVAGPSITPSW